MSVESLAELLAERCYVEADVKLAEHELNNEHRKGVNGIASVVVNIIAAYRTRGSCFSLTGVNRVVSYSPKGYDKVTSLVPPFPVKDAFDTSELAQNIPMFGDGNRLRGTYHGSASKEKPFLISYRTHEEGFMNGFMGCKDDFTLDRVTYRVLTEVSAAHGWMECMMQMPSVTPEESYALHILQRRSAKFLEHAERSQNLVWAPYFRRHHKAPKVTS